MRKGKFRYLYQLVFTSIILIVVPVLFFYNVVWKKSFDEINHINAEYYRKAVSTFSNTFLSEVLEFKKYANRLSLNSRYNSADSGFLYEASEKVEENKYYYYEVAQDFYDNSRNAGFDMAGIYYYDKDVLYTNGSKYSLQRYIESVKGVTESAWVERLMDFFNKDVYKEKAVIYAPLYNETDSSVDFFVGLCTTVGKNKDKVLIFNQIVQSDMEFYVASMKERLGEKYYVLDNTTGEILYSAGMITESIKIGPQCIVLETDNKKQSKWFMEEMSFMNLTFLVDVSDDEVQNNVMAFYQDMKIFFWYIILSMTVISGSMVYINYRPMHRLLKKIKYTGKNEFEAILNVWKDQNDLLSEQRTMLMDLLMNHLLYGIPVSQKYVKELGVSSRISHYCVFLIKNKVLRVSEMEMIVAEGEEAYRALLLITDLTGENSTIIICCMEHDKSEAIMKWLKNWCQEHIKEDYYLKTGCVVDKIEQIRKSFLDCTREKKERSTEKNDDTNETISERVRNRSEVNEKLKEDVLNYLDEHYTDANLSQTQVTDHFQISVYSLTKMFNSQIGMGFVKYVNAKRVEYAKELLVTTELSVKDIAGMVGIPDDNYFSRIFRKYTDLSPSEYRDEMNVL